MLHSDSFDVGWERSRDALDEKDMDLEPFSALRLTKVLVGPLTERGLVVASVLGALYQEDVILETGHTESYRVGPTRAALTVCIGPHKRFNLLASGKALGWRATEVA